MNINTEIAIRVKKYRNKSIYTQENIADMLGVSRVNYVNLEAGKQNWKCIYLYTLCRIFKCRPTNLFPEIDPVKVKSKIESKKTVRIINKQTFYKIK